MQGLQCTKHSSKCFTYIHSFNPTFSLKKKKLFLTSTVVRLRLFYYLSIIGNLAFPSFLLRSSHCLWCPIISGYVARNGFVCFCYGHDLMAKTENFHLSFNLHYFFYFGHHIFFILPSPNFVFFSLQFLLGIFEPSHFLLMLFNIFSRCFHSFFLNS